MMNLQNARAAGSDFFSKKSFLFSFLLLVAPSMVGMEKKKEVTYLFSDFKNETEEICALENIFKSDYKNLVGGSTQGHLEGVGVTTYQNCVSDAEINERKILKIDGKSVGFFIFFVSNNNQTFKHFKDGDGILALMGVHSECRRKGYGSVLMAHVLQRFSELKCNNAWLSVKKSNFAAQALYAKFGFKNTLQQSFGSESEWWHLELRNKKAQETFLL